MLISDENPRERARRIVKAYEAWRTEEGALRAVAYLDLAQTMRDHAVFVALAFVAGREESDGRHR
jgi:hypothetical protein